MLLGIKPLRHNRAAVSPRLPQNCCGANFGPSCFRTLLAHFIESCLIYLNAIPALSSRIGFSLPELCTYNCKSCGVTVTEVENQKSGAIHDPGELRRSLARFSRRGWRP